ncbi:hypothetical protein H0H93_007619, partial [Arthromyces matolae]
NPTKESKVFCSAIPSKIRHLYAVLPYDWCCRKLHRKLYRKSDIEAAMEREENKTDEPLSFSRASYLEGTIDLLLEFSEWYKDTYKPRRNLMERRNLKFLKRKAMQERVKADVLLSTSTAVKTSWAFNRDLTPLNDHSACDRRFL